MAIQIFTDQNLKKLLDKDGFVLNVDYPTRDMKIHNTGCPHVNPDNPTGAKPSSKTTNKTGEFWFSTDRRQIDRKAEEIARKKGYALKTCDVCNP